MKKKQVDLGVCIPLLCIWFAHIYMSYKIIILKHPVPYKTNTIQIKNKYQEEKSNIYTQFKNCTLFYLDMGTNIGVQIRKLFQPEHYPNSPVLPMFDQHFGPISSRRANPRLCAVGFELNPRHTQRLKTLERNYNECGFQTFIFTETAVGAYDGNTSFWTDNETEMMEWGASTVRQWPGQAPVQVKAINIGKFISENIIPHAQTIVAKMDIEGAEHSALPNLLAHEVLCKFNLLFLETHERMMKPEESREFIDFYQNLKTRLHSPQCKVEITNLDDETYLKDESNRLDSCRPPNQLNIPH